MYKRQFVLRENHNHELGGKTDDPGPSYRYGGGIIGALIALSRPMKGTLVDCAVAGDIDGQPFSVRQQAAGRYEYADGTLVSCIVELAGQLAPSNPGQAIKSDAGAAPDAAATQAGGQDKAAQ